MSHKELTVTHDHRQHQVVTSFGPGTCGLLTSEALPAPKTLPTLYSNENRHSGSKGSRKKNDSPLPSLKKSHINDICNTTILVCSSLTVSPCGHQLAQEVLSTILPQMFLQCTELGNHTVYCPPPLSPPLSERCLDTLDHKEI